MIGKYIGEKEDTGKERLAFAEDTSQIS